MNNILYVLLFISSIMASSSEYCPSETSLKSLLPTETKLIAWRHSMKDDWSNSVNLHTSNGIEIEGVIEFQGPNRTNRTEITEKLVAFLQDHPSGIIEDIHYKEFDNRGHIISFSMNGVKKSVKVEKENIVSGIEPRSHGVEFSSHIIENKDDLYLLSDIQRFFYDSKVHEQTSLAGIHNHLGLKRLLKNPVINDQDFRIQELGKNFKKIEQGLFDYFGTHPYRNASSGRIKSTDSYIKKNKAIRITKISGDKEFLTIEIRLFNAFKDPTYLAEAMNFNNSFFKNYFDETSGLKAWIEKQDIVDTKKLFEKLDLPFNQRKYDYDILPGKLQFFDGNIEIFGTDIDKGLTFLQKTIAAFPERATIHKEVLFEFMKYINYLSQEKNISSPSILKQTKKFLDSQKKHYRSKGEIFNISELNGVFSFDRLTLDLKRELLNYFFPKGLIKANKKDLSMLLSTDLARTVNILPFSDEELHFLFNFAKENGEIADMVRVLRLYNKNLNNHLLSIKGPLSEQEIEAYKTFIDSNLVSPQTRKYILNLTKPEN